VPPIGDADLSAWVDGRLEAGRADLVEAWLARPENATARARIERWRRQDGALRAALDPILSEPVPERLRAAIAGAPRRRRTRLRWLVPAAVAAVLGLAVGAGGGLALWGPQPAVAGELADAGMAAH